jgi:peptide-methionine (R)-S-oxide reductase
MRSTDPDRRRFLGVFAATAVAAISLPVILRGIRPAVAADAPPTPKTGNVTLDEFGANKKLIDTRSVPRVVMTDEQWKEKLSTQSYYVTREAGTEAPYSGKGYDSHANGLYRCICCDTALYDSATKFESGTGWPSFYQPISKRNIAQATDRSLIEERTEVKCARCDAHLGHVFDDGPDPTGLRYCMNSVAMRFVAFVA